MPVLSQSSRRRRIPPPPVVRLICVVSSARHIFTREPGTLVLSGTSTTKEDLMTDRKELDKRPTKNTQAEETAARLRHVRRLARGFMFP